MMHIYCGDGKGKTTAALGLALRAAGNGMRVHFVQFLKGSATSELASLARIPEITVLRCDRDYGFTFRMTDAEKAALTRCHNAMLRQVQSRLPETDARSEVIVLCCQHNAYDKAIEAAGAKPVMIGDADETTETELAGAIGENTAAVFYFPNIRYETASLPLEKVIGIAHGKGIPVIVDAAALLPPVENLWRFTGMGADLAIFSGGKTLCGPQDSGLILGRADLIRDCLRDIGK